MLPLQVYVNTQLQHLETAAPEHAVRYRREYRAGQQARRRALAGWAGERLLRAGAALQRWSGSPGAAGAHHGAGPGERLAQRG